MRTETVTFVYWITTALFSLMMAISGIAYLMNPRFQERFTHLGFPSFFRIELAFGKFVGVLVLLLPIRPPFKEWAYAGFFITLFSAVLAHFACRDGLRKALAPVMVAVLLAVSYLTSRILAAR